MAQLITCDGPDGSPAVFMVNNIDNAEVHSFCLPCMLDFAQALLQAFTPERLAAPPAKAARKSRAKAPAAVADDGKDGAGDDDAPPF